MTDRIRGFFDRYIVPTPFDYLVAGEKRLYSERRHIFWLAEPVSRPFAMFLASVGLASWIDDQRVQTLIALIGAGALMWALYIVVDWLFARVYVSDSRLFEIRGFLTVRVGTLPLGKVTDMSFEQTIWGRAFGYGELRVETAGQRQALERIRYLRRPLRFYQIVTGKALGHDIRPMLESVGIDPDKLPSWQPTVD